MLPRVGQAYYAHRGYLELAVLRTPIKQDWFFRNILYLAGDISNRNRYNSWKVPSHQINNLKAQKSLLPLEPIKPLKYTMYIVSESFHGLRVIQWTVYVTENDIFELCSGLVFSQPQDDHFITTIKREFICDEATEQTKMVLQFQLNFWIYH